MQKKTFAAGLLALVLCAAMLMSPVSAWFTAPVAADNVVVNTQEVERYNAAAPITQSIDADGLMEITGTSRMEMSADKLGLAFRFDLECEGADIDSQHVGDYSKATIKVGGKTYKLVSAGAVVTNNPYVGDDESRFIRDNITEDKRVIDIPAVFWYNTYHKEVLGIQSTGITFAVRITNIPTDCDTTDIYARAYYVFEKDGQQVTVYDDINIANYKETTKFKKKFTGDFLYRVGNGNAVKLDSLFSGTNVAGDVSVKVESMGDTGADATYTPNTTQWNDGTLNFTGTGVVKVTITDNNKCKPTVLILEVVDAVNATGATSATTNNVVLLNDTGLSSLTVSGRYTFYGNGFTMTYSNDGRYLNNGLKQGIVTLSEHGVLDNVRIVATVYPAAYMYYDTNSIGPAVKDGPKEVDGTKTRYYYQLSAVAVSGNATIQNCYIYGSRNNVYVNEGNVTVKDSVLECGTLANMQIQSSSDYTVTLDNVTTIQHQVNPTIGDTSLVMMGAGIVVGPETASDPKIVLNGDFKQYNWVTKADANAVSNDTAKTLINSAVNVTSANYTINGQTASNLGIIYMNTDSDAVENNTGLPYKMYYNVAVSTAKGNVYSYEGGKATEDQLYWDYANADKSTENGLYQPQFKFDSTLGGQAIAKTDDGDEFCYLDGETVKVMFISGDTKTMDLAGLVNIAKYTNQNLNLQISCKDPNGNAVAVSDNKVTLANAGNYTITYAVTDAMFFDELGNAVNCDPINYSWNVTLDVALKEKTMQNARFEFDTSKQVLYYNGNSNRTQFIPFLAGLKIYDYDQNGNEYLRFDGDSTENGYNKVSSVECTNDTNAKRSEITLGLTDGGVLKVALYPRATSGGSTYSGSVKVADNVLYFVNGGTTSAKGQQWLIYGYTIVGNNGVEINSGELYFGKEGVDATSKSKPTANFGSSSGGGSSDSCITPDTLITLADGSQVRVDSLKGDEMLLVWNMETGKYDAAPIVFVDSEDEAEYEIVHLYFSDGSDVKVIYEHGFFDLDLGKYVYIDANNYADYVGHKFVTQGDVAGNQWNVVTLDNVAIEYEVTTAWSPVTFSHLCYYTNGVLSMPGGINGLFNIFEVDTDTMTYDAEAMQKDIETYGLLTLEDFGGLITQDAFDAFNGAYLQIAIGKGNLTWEDIAYMAERYIPLM